MWGVPCLFVIDDLDFQKSLLWVTKQKFWRYFVRRNSATHQNPIRIHVSPSVPTAGFCLEDVLQTVLSYIFSEQSQFKMISTF